ncbi:MAG TPA: hypothetical protein VGH12_01020 [Steroidobacteraceae bacterium]
MGSNLIWAIFSALALGTAGAAAGLGASAGFGTAIGLGGAIFARDAGFAAAGLDAGLVGFTVTFDVAMGLAFVGGRAALFGAAAL